MDTYEEKKSTEKKVKKIRTEKLRRAKISKARKGKGRKKRVGRPRRRKKKDKYIPNVVGAKAKQSKDGNVYVISAKRGPYKRTEMRPKNVKGTWNPNAPVGGWTGWTSDAVNQAKLERRMDGFLPNRREQESNRIARSNANKLRQQQEDQEQQRNEIQGQGAEIGRLKAELERNERRYQQDRSTADRDARRGRRGPTPSMERAPAGTSAAGAPSTAYRPDTSHHARSLTALTSHSGTTAFETARAKKTIGQHIKGALSRTSSRAESQMDKDSEASRLSGEAAQRRTRQGGKGPTLAYALKAKLNKESKMRGEGSNVWGVTPISAGDTPGMFYVDRFPKQGGARKNPGWNPSGRTGWADYTARTRAT